MKNLFVKKVIASVAVACMLITAAPQFGPLCVDIVSAAATADVDEDTNNDGVSDSGFVYVSNGTGTVAIRSYNGTAVALTVPKAIKANGIELSVTEISAKCFAGNAGLQSVVMPGADASTGSGSSGTAAHPGLLTIKDQAFYGCPSLTSVTIPNTVTSIGLQVFGDCPRLSAFTVTPGNQRYISYDGVLYEYSGIPTGTSYGTYTLMQYPVGKTGSIYAPPADIASRITAVGKGAFSGSLQLESVDLPQTVTSIGSYAFCNCISLKNINIPDKVSLIDNSTFEGCTSLESISLPDNIGTIGSGIFSGCSSLRTVKLPANIPAIPTKAFYGCSSLDEVTVPSRVTSIDYDAFAYCTNLRKVTIPTSVSMIQSGAFTGNTGVTIYSHSGSYAETYATNNHLGRVSTYTVKFYSDVGALLDTQEVVYGSAAVAPYVIPRPGYELSWSTSFASITSDLSVSAVWARVYNVTFKDAYNGRSEVVKVEYGKNATPPSWKLSGYTLSWDRSTKNITSDTEINAIWTDHSTGYKINNSDAKPAKKGTMINAGAGMYKVISDDIQNPKVKYMGCSDGTLTVVNIPGTVTVDGIKYKVTQITAGAFKENTTVKSIYIGSNVQLIGSAAFKGCTSLTKISIKSKKLKTVNLKAFYGMSKNCYVYAYNSKLKAYLKLIDNSGINTKITMRRL